MGPGDHIDRYEVVELLGEGAIARVYRVRHRTLGTEHAVKVLRLDRTDLRDRMLQEGRVQARLKHPNVVAVTGIIDRPELLGLVMECVHGASLARYLEAREALPVADALLIFDQVLAGVEAAHDGGVLHRDLKPANILLEQGANGLVPKVTDFGIAKVFDSYARAGRTRARTMMGTPGYTAPEQWVDSASVDARADVFSLGVILYEMLTGRLPYAGDTPTVVFKATSKGEHAPLRELLPACPDRVVDAVERAISPVVGERFRDARAFRDVLIGRGDTLPPRDEEDDSDSVLEIELSAPTREVPRDRVARFAGDQETEERPVPAAPPSAIPTLIDLPRAEAALSPPAVPMRLRSPERVEERVPFKRVAAGVEPARDRAGFGTLDPMDRSVSGPVPRRWAPLLLGVAVGPVVVFGAAWLGWAWWRSRAPEQPGHSDAAIVDLLADDGAALPCAGGSDEVLGYWNAGQWFDDGAGRVFVVRRDTPVYAALPEAGAAEGEPACLLPKGQRVAVPAVPKRTAGHDVWVSLRGADIVHQEDGQAPVDSAAPGEGDGPDDPPPAP